jgi:6-pyruvoyltetrahydropterin/6-carboxytetrahydropterin synthase
LYEVTVAAGFHQATRLRNYHGKRENPHGHNYNVKVTLAGKSLDQTGLLFDFKLLNEVLPPIVDHLDHQMINNLPPFTEINPSALESGAILL